MTIGHASAPRQRSKSPPSARPVHLDCFMWKFCEELRGRTPRIESSPTNAEMETDISRDARIAGAAETRHRKIGRDFSRAISLLADSMDRGFSNRRTLRRASTKLDSKLNRVANSALGIRETRPETGKRTRFPRLSLKKARSISFATDWSNRTYSRRANDVGRSFISREELAKTKSRSQSSSDRFDRGGERKYTWRRVIGATARSLSPFQAIVAYANVID